MVSSNKQFAILIPTGLITEIARKEDINGVVVYDKEIEVLVHDLSKAILSQTNDTWLMRVQGESKTTEVLLSEAFGCTLDSNTSVVLLLLITATLFFS